MVCSVGCGRGGCEGRGRLELDCLGGDANFNYWLECRTYCFIKDFFKDHDRIVIDSAYLQYPHHI
jgi:hypothetical protein